MEEGYYLSGELLGYNLCICSALIYHQIVFKSGCPNVHSTQQCVSSSEPSFLLSICYMPGTV